MSKTFDVCIRGDGIVGRTLALLLARERLKVALVTRAARPVTSPPGELSDVRAYSLNAASRQVLEPLRAWPEAGFATPVNSMKVWGDDGGQLDFVAPTGQQNDPLAWIVDVPALEAQLLEACRYQGHIETVDESAPATLSVICEGKHSASRALAGSAWHVKPYDQKAVAARLLSTQPHGGVARQWFSNGDILALLPVGGPDGRGLALVWSVATGRAAQLEALSPDEFCAALRAVCGAEAGALQLTSARASWPLALAQAGQWVGPGWALAGDAAHTIHPLAGQGLNLGLADAACLASVLASREYWRQLGDEKLLRRYERARKADVGAMGLVTDSLHNLFAQTTGPWQGLRNWGMTSLGRSSTVKNWLARQASGRGIHASASADSAKPL